MNKMKTGVFTLLAVSILTLGFYAQAAEEVLSHVGIADRLSQREALVSPFQVIVDRTGMLAVQPRATFSEGIQDPDLELPTLLTRPVPISVPPLILNQNWEGEVVLAVAVRIDGTVSETMVMESSGNEILDQWASQLMQGWQFRPAMKNGQAVYECIQIPILFQLKKTE